MASKRAAAKLQSIAAVLAWACLLLQAVPSQGYAEYWVKGDHHGIPSKSCYDHPTSASVNAPEVVDAGSPHEELVTDKDVLFTVVDANSTPVNTVCPGQAYSLQLSYNNPRYKLSALLTTTVGSLAYGGAAPDATCPGRVTLGESHRSNKEEFSYTLAWTVPCEADLSAGALIVATAVVRGYAWRENSLTVAKGASCNFCGTPVPEPSPSPSPEPGTSPEPKPAYGGYGGYGSYGKYGSYGYY